MIAVVAGSTGLTGQSLINQLLADPKWKSVVAVTRRALTEQNPKLRQVLVNDLSQLQAHGSELKGDAYFCCLGTTIKTAGSEDAFYRIDHDAVLAFAKVAKANNALFFATISSVGADTKSAFFYTRTKGETERDLQAIGFRSLVIFRPTLFVGERKEFRTLEKVASAVAGTLEVLLPKRLKKSLMTKVPELTARMKSVAEQAPEGLTLISAKDI